VQSGDKGRTPILYDQTPNTADGPFSSKRDP
jgi:hypothetical protein